MDNDKKDDEFLIIANGDMLGKFKIKLQSKELKEKEINKYFDRIDTIIERLETQKGLIRESLNCPSMLFDKASEIIKSTHEPIFQIFNVYEDNKRKMNVHEFQNFLCSIINNHFVQYFNSHKVEVKVRNNNSFPSIYAVYYNGLEIIQFDIFNRFYGVREIKTEEMIHREQDERKKYHDIELERLTSKLSAMEQARQHTFNYIVNYHRTKNNGGIRNKLYYGTKELLQLAFQKNKIYSGMDKLIEKYKKDINDENVKYDRFDTFIEDMQNLEMKVRAIKVIEPIFRKHNYRLETEKYSLY